MAVSVNRQIEGNLTRVMGQRDPVGLIRASISGSHQGLRSRAVPTGRTHDSKWLFAPAGKKTLQSRGHPHMTRGPLRSSQ
jgi:hypothetical protein